MANRLSIFEFVSYKSMPDPVSELINELHLTEGLEERLTVQQRQGLVNRGSQLIDNLEAIMKNPPPHPPYTSTMQPSYEALQRDFMPFVSKELGKKFYTLVLHLSQIYPEYFQDRQELLQAAQLANNDPNNMPLDPSRPAYGQSIDADSLPPVSQRSQKFNAALGLDDIKNTFGSPDANKVNIPDQARK